MMRGVFQKCSFTMPQISVAVALAVLTSFGLYSSIDVIREFFKCIYHTECENGYMLSSRSVPIPNYSETECFFSRNVVLYCDFKPLQEMLDDSKEVSISMNGLLSWQNPHENNITLKIGDFRPLLPPAGARVGYIWNMVEPVNYLETSKDDLSMRFMDKKPQSGSATSVLYRILSMFHKNVFMQTRFSPRGTVAVLRAQNSAFMDIVFRCHAEFQLNNPPLLPFWFTPSQFQGHFIIAKDFSKILNFSLTVPTNRKLNVDMEWFEKLDEDMVVEISFVPKMLIHTKATVNQQNMNWNEEIAMQEAHVLLEQEMFPFKEVVYSPITEALTELEHQKKLLHCIVLWGALDDQSC
ncbi:hypothetical protein R5R35_010292 [Gryllus longicercus]|uniref:Uncharacterized protein n=2 Tax=Gryllus longicercus TaxID=2509291 RepID=A0AAN9VD71_9ORTH